MNNTLTQHNEIGQQNEILKNFIGNLKPPLFEDALSLIDQRVYAEKKAEAKKSAPSKDDDTADDQSHFQKYELQAEYINHQGLDVQLAYLNSTGCFYTLCFLLGISLGEPKTENDLNFSDQWAQKIFLNTNFGTQINGDPTLQKAQLAKTLRDQMGGYWSGHTAYHLAVNAKLLHDGPASTLKHLTESGLCFLTNMRNKLPKDFFSSLVKPMVKDCEDNIF